MRGERIILPLVTAGVILGAWDLAIRVTKTKVFPPPADVLHALVTLAERKTLWVYSFDSLMRVLAGYGLAVALAIPIGLLIGWMPKLGSAVNPLIQMLRPISPIAWMPLAVIWFGVSNAAPIFLIFLASFFPVVVAAANAVREIPAVYMAAGRNFGLTRSQLLRRIVLPAVLPRIVVGLRIAFGVAWLVLVAAEMIAVDSGLGYLIIDARNAGKRYDLVVGGMLVIGLLGLILDSLFRRAEKLPALRWGFRENK
jgi:NitT/TauT family transport system permease protein